MVSECWEIKSEVKGQHTIQRSPRAMLICLISFLKVRLLTVTAGHPAPHSPPAGGSPSLLLDAKVARGAPRDATGSTTTALNARCHIGPLLGSGKTGTGKTLRKASRPSLWTNGGSATVLAR